jgi:hypothetical protein
MNLDKLTQIIQLQHPDLTLRQARLRADDLIKQLHPGSSRPSGSIRNGGTN